MDETLIESRNRLLKFVQNKFNLFEGNRWDSTAVSVSAATRGEDQPEWGTEQSQPSGPTSMFADDLRYGLDEEDMPVIVSEQDATIRGEQPSASAPQQLDTQMDLFEEVAQQEEVEMGLNEPKVLVSDVERDVQMYGWRYPALYDYMVESGGKEDLVMTATRLLDQIPPTVGDELAAAEKQWELAKDLINPASRQDQDVLYAEVVRLRFLTGARGQAVRFLEDDIGKRTRVES